MESRDILLDFLRKGTENPSLQLKIVLDPTLAPPETLPRRSLEEKREQMLAINPVLSKLEELFNTSLDG